MTACVLCSMIWVTGKVNEPCWWCFRLLMIPYHYATFHTPVFKCPAAFQSLDPTTQASRLHFNGKIEEQLHFSLQQKTNEKKARNFCAKSLASFYWFAQSRFNSWSYQRLIVRSSHKLTKKLSFKTLMMNRSKTILEGRKKNGMCLGHFCCLCLHMVETTAFIIFSIGNHWNWIKNHESTPHLFTSQEWKGKKVATNLTKDQISRSWKPDCNWLASILIQLLWKYFLCKMEALQKAHWCWPLSLSFLVWKMRLSQTSAHIAPHLIVKHCSVTSLIIFCNTQRHASCIARPYKEALFTHILNSMSIKHFYTPTSWCPF